MYVCLKIRKAKCPTKIKYHKIQYRYWSVREADQEQRMFDSICLLITALSAVSREIRCWIELRKREKDDESHPPFLNYSFGTTIYT